MVTIPLFTDETYLSLEEYGAFSLLEITSQILIAILSFELGQALVRWYWDKEYLGKQKSIFFTVICFLLCIIVVVGGACSFWLPELSTLLLGDTTYTQVLALVLLYSFIEMLNVMIFNLIRLQGKALLFGGMSVLSILVSYACILFFVIQYKMGLQGIYLGFVIGSTVCLLGHIRLLKNNIEWRVELPILKQMLLFASPLILSSIFGILLAFADRYSIKYISNNIKLVGVYALGFKIANTIKVVCLTSFQNAIQPTMFKMMDAPNNKRFYSKVMTYLCFVLTIVVLASCLFAKEVVHLFASSNQYYSASMVIPLIAYSIIFSGMRDVASMGLIIKKKTPLISTFIIISSVANLVLNFAFIPFMGILGAALASLLVQALFFALVLRSAQRLFPVPYEIKKILTMLGLSILLYGSLFFIENWPMWLSVSMKFTLLVIFPWMLFKFHFFEQTEVQIIREAFTKWRKIRDLPRNLSNVLAKKEPLSS